MTTKWRQDSSCRPPIRSFFTYLSRYTYIQYNGNNNNNNILPNSVIHHLPNSVNVRAGLYNDNNKNEILTAAPYGCQIQGPSLNLCLSRILSRSRSRSRCLSLPPPNGAEFGV